MADETKDGAGGGEIIKASGSGLEAISVDEQRQLAEAEDTIEACVTRAYVEIGTALQTIRDRRLYRSSYCSWMAYCRERWGFTQRRADQMVAAARVGRRLQDAGVEWLPNARQAQEMVHVPDPVRVWESLVEEAPKTLEGRPRLRAADVRRQVAPKPITAEEAYKELTGEEPPKADEMSRARAQFKDAVRTVLLALDAVKQLEDTKPGRDFLEEYEAVDTLLDLMNALEARRPTGSCPQCLGAGCPRCGNLGYRRGGKLTSK